MSSSEALVIWILRIAMKAPIMAARTAIQSRVLARSDEAGAGAASDAFAVRVDMTWSSWTSAQSSAIALAGGRCLRIDARLNGHSRTQIAGGRAIGIDGDLDGNALDNLREVARRVIRRQQGEFLAARGRQAIDTTV